MDRRRASEPAHTSPLVSIVWLVTDHQALAGRPESASRNTLQRRLANEGIRFSRAYTVLPICSPARASMLTGLYPSTHGLTENDGRFGGRPGLGPEDWLIHRPLIENGFRCAWFGKWHLDNERSASDYGFEGFSLPGYGYPYSTTQYQNYLASYKLAAPRVNIEQSGESGIPPGTTLDLTQQQSWYDYEAGCAVLDGSVETHEAYFLADQAISWLENVGDQPFFLRVDPWGPHPPYIVDKTTAASSGGVEEALSPNYSMSLDERPEHHRLYRDFWQDKLDLDHSGWALLATRALQHATLVEEALANIVTALDRLGLAENTLVVFTADHGDAVSSNGGVANKGSLMVEETMRIPLLMRGPGLLSGVVNEQLVSNMDIAPTLLALNGLVSPYDSHGKSLVPYLLDGSTDAIRQGLLTQCYGLHAPDLQRAYYQDNWKLIVQHTGFCELYDLGEDPHELDNLAGVAWHRPTLEILWAKMVDAMRDIDDLDPRLSTILDAPV